MKIIRNKAEKNSLKIFAQVKFLLCVMMDSSI